MVAAGGTPEPSKPGATQQPSWPSLERWAGDRCMAKPEGSDIAVEGIFRMMSINVTSLRPHISDMLSDMCQEDP
eukprot:1386851-Alexandrium_andersonii.AAC.1